jgi:hypothetical protein
MLTNSLALFATHSRDVPSS